MTAQQIERAPIAVVPVVMKELGYTKEEARRWITRNLPKGRPLRKADVMAAIERTKELRRKRRAITPTPVAEAPTPEPEMEF